ncbi:MAG: NigD-like C-terminal domain-containing protein [Rikenellaceae bacterium]
MKNNLLLTALVSSLALVSCNKNDDTPEWGTYPDSAAYATVHVVESLENADEEKYYYQTDKGTKLFLADNMITADYEFEDNTRSIIYFTLIEDYSKEGSEELEGASYDCEYGLRLFGIRNVHASQRADVTTEEESDAIADHAISYIYTNFSYGYDYINLIAGIRADKLADVNFYLVKNDSCEPEDSKDGYLSLELRYDRGTDEAIGSTYDEYISLSLADFAEELEGMDGVIVRVKTLQNGTSSFKVDFDDEEESSERAKSINKNATKI